jgi:multidrug efflux pump subunit AcrA (membrane-fusion protein)
VEEVVRAPGRVEPAGRVKLVNHPRGGRVAELHVRDGDKVKAGQPLVTFDTRQEASERAELLGRWQALTVEAARLEAEASGAKLAVPAGGRGGAGRPGRGGRPPAARPGRGGGGPPRGRRAAGPGPARRAAHRRVRGRPAAQRPALLRQQLDAVRELAARGLYPNLKLVAAEKQLSDTRASWRRRSRPKAPPRPRSPRPRAGWPGSTRTGARPPSTSWRRRWPSATAWPSGWEAQRPSSTAWS